MLNVILLSQTREELEAARKHESFFGLKLYPAGATTNSDGGVTDFGEAEKTFRAMEELGIPLLVHGESHGFVMDREAEFLPTYRRLAQAFPRPKISTNTPKAKKSRLRFSNASTPSFTATWTRATQSTP